jgi:acyl-coenzyme A thioesterase PaaI-like protein
VARRGDGGPDRSGRIHRSWPPGKYIHVETTSTIADSAGPTGYPDNASVLTIDYKINVLAPAAGDYLEAEGVVISRGAVSVCRPEVYATQGVTRTLVAAGLQTLFLRPGSDRTVDPRRLGRIAVG